MKTIEIIVGVLVCVMFVGIVALMKSGIDVALLMPLMTVLIGYLVGRRQDDIAKVFLRRKAE